MEILFSLRWYVELILQGRTLSLYSKFFRGVFGGGTRLAMPKTTLRAGLVVIESLVQGLLWESWIRGSSDSRTIPSAGLLDYEDTGLKTLSRVRMGLYLAWKAS